MDHPQNNRRIKTTAKYRLTQTWVAAIKVAGDSQVLARTQGNESPPFSWRDCKVLQSLWGTSLAVSF